MSECKGTTTTIHFPLPRTRPPSSRKRRSRFVATKSHECLLQVRPRQGSSGVLNPGQSLPILVGQRAIEALLSLRAAPARSTPPSSPPANLPPPSPATNHARRHRASPRSPPSDPLPSPPHVIHRRVGGLAASSKHRLKVPPSPDSFPGPRTLISITTRNHSPCVFVAAACTQRMEGSDGRFVWCDMESRTAGDDMPSSRRAASAVGL